MTRKSSDRLSGRFHVAMFKALGAPNRIELVCRLAACNRPATVSELTCCCPVDVSVVSRHLAQLRDAGIIEGERKGKEVYYSVRHSFVADQLRTLADAIDSCCGSCCKKEKPSAK